MLTGEAGRLCSLLHMYILTGVCKVFCSVSAGALFCIVIIVLFPYVLYAVPQWQTDAVSIVSCLMIFVTFVTIGAATSSCLLSMLLSFASYC